MLTRGLHESMHPHHQAWLETMLPPDYYAFSKVVWRLRVGHEDPIQKFISRKVIEYQQIVERREKRIAEERHRQAKTRERKDRMRRCFEIVNEQIDDVTFFHAREIRNLLEKLTGWAPEAIAKLRDRARDTWFEKHRLQQLTARDFYSCMVLRKLAGDETMLSPRMQAEAPTHIGALQKLIELRIKELYEDVTVSRRVEKDLEDWEGGEDGKDDGEEGGRGGSEVVSGEDSPLAFFVSCCCAGRSGNDESTHIYQKDF
mmetsp:Transcript_13302/g.49389  ORF Transcript_13302/g.49389 Transcript_13302/m.49389 type:complete len:258 (-) Transcript_13302:8-781(-)